MRSVIDGLESRFCLRDFSDNERTATYVPQSEDRFKIGSLVEDRHRGRLQLNEYLTKLGQFDINFIESAGNFENKSNGCVYDCRDWTLGNAGLSKYIKEVGVTINNALVSKCALDIVWVPEPREGGVVLYFDGSSAKHWGIIDSIGDNIRVNSKWGALDVYNHPLASVPDSYGDQASFFEPRS